MKADEQNGEMGEVKERAKASSLICHYGIQKCYTASTMLIQVGRQKYLARMKHTVCWKYLYQSSKSNKVSSITKTIELSSEKPTALLMSFHLQQRRTLFHMVTFN